MKISVVAATYNRAHLLTRSLVRYERQDFPLGDMELIYVTDWDTDETDKLLREWSTKMNIVCIRPPYKKPGTWRSEASIINLGIRAARGELIIATHPEVMPGNLSLTHMWDHREDSAYHACKVYYMTEKDQELIDTVPWQETNLSVRQIPDFYTEQSAEFSRNENYTHAATDRHKSWESWVFGGMLRKTWQKLGGFHEFETWGSTDVWFLGARAHHGILTRTELNPETFCIHQNHDDPSKNVSVTPRNMEAALVALRGISPSPDNLWR